MQRARRWQLVGSPHLEQLEAHVLLALAEVALAEVALAEVALAEVALAESSPPLLVDDTPSVGSVRFERPRRVSVAFERPSRQLPPRSAT